MYKCLPPSRQLWFLLATDFKVPIQKPVWTLGKFYQNKLKGMATLGWNGTKLNLSILRILKLKAAHFVHRLYCCSLFAPAFYELFTREFETEFQNP